MTQQKKWTTHRIKAQKGKAKIACLTAYDATTARLVDEAGIGLIMVGDSLAMTRLGYENTLPVTMAEMTSHSAAVARGTTHALVVTDMPFLSYQVSTLKAIVHAGTLIKHGGADAVKLEGGALRKEVVEALVENGIPVMGHLGLTPQSVHEMGGYKVQGKLPEEAEKMIEDARVLEKAGVFSMVLEGIPSTLAKEITAAVSVPTIGIGAGPDCDGQILVVNDVLGLSGEFSPKFVKRYANVEEIMSKAFSAYRNDVEQGDYPAQEHCY